MPLLKDQVKKAFNLNRAFEPEEAMSEDYSEHQEEHRRPTIRGHQNARTDQPRPSTSRPTYPQTTTYNQVYPPYGSLNHNHNPGPYTNPRPSYYGPNYNPGHGSYTNPPLPSQQYPQGHFASPPPAGGSPPGNQQHDGPHTGNFSLPNQGGTHSSWPQQPYGQTAQRPPLGGHHTGSQGHGQASHGYADASPYNSPPSHASSSGNNGSPPPGQNFGSYNNGQSHQGFGNPGPYSPPSGSSASENSHVNNAQSSGHCSHELVRRGR